jgi:hypothetical protein
VLSHTDPGVQNWLDTSGLQNGLFTYRYVRPEHASIPRTTVVEAADARTHLPASTPVFSTVERRNQIDARRRGVARRFRR